MLNSMFLKIRKLLDKVGKSSMGRFGALLALVDLVFPALLLVVLIATFTGVSYLLTKSNMEGKPKEVFHLSFICVRQNQVAPIEIIASLKLAYVKLRF